VAERKRIISDPMRNENWRRDMLATIV